jgi:hypothetical protein
VFTAVPDCTEIGIDKGIAHHTCAPLFTVVDSGLSSNCRQLTKKAILRTLRDVVLQFRQKLRADERTRTAFLLQLRVIGQAFQGCAGGCKSRISKRLPLLRVAACFASYCVPGGVKVCQALRYGVSANIVSCTLKTYPELVVSHCTLTTAKEICPSSNVLTPSYDSGTSTLENTMIAPRDIPDACRYANV